MKPKEDTVKHEAWLNSQLERVKSQRSTQKCKDISTSK